MRDVVWKDLDKDERARVLARPERRRAPEVAAVVRRIFDDVEKDGIAGLARWAQELDGRPPERLELSDRAVAAARGALDAEDIRALETAVANVRSFHEAERPRDSCVMLGAGLACRRVWRAIPSAGLYVPGGVAPLFSTLVMLAEPARAAGVLQRIVTTPPGKSGELDPTMIAAAAACGLEEVFVIGGAQAIAAMTFGVFTPRAEKIFGPGNAYVAEAKRYAASLACGPQIDLPAGPSELMVIADETASATLAARDLLSQAEHDADAQVLLVSTSARLIAETSRALLRFAAALSSADIARAALRNARAILVDDLSAAADVANAYAPEHLSLQVDDPESLLVRIENAGAVFMGAASAEAFGDYVAGPSHVLPTDGAARSWSGVSTASFMKCLSVQALSEDAAAALAPAAARLARLEGLEAHALAAEARMK